MWELDSFINIIICRRRGSQPLQQRLVDDRQFTVEHQSLLKINTIISKIIYLLSRINWTRSKTKSTVLTYSSNGSCGHARCVVPDSCKLPFYSFEINALGNLRLMLHGGLGLQLKAAPPSPIPLMAIATTRKSHRSQFLGLIFGALIEQGHQGAKNLLST